jgi:hypothetical protein
VATRTRSIVGLTIPYAGCTTEGEAVTATTHHHRPTQSPARLAFGRLAVIAVALVAGAGLGLATVAMAEPPAPNVCRTDPAIPPISVNAPFIYERGLHRVNSPVPGPEFRGRRPT